MGLTTPNADGTNVQAGKGPHGLGDPDDQSLRKVEIDVCIPKIMRDRAKHEKCVEEVQAFTKCCASSSLLMAFKCQTENKIMQDCQTKWYQDEDFKKECKEQYLQERREYRLTGLTKKRRAAASGVGAASPEEMATGLER